MIRVSGNFLFNDKEVNAFSSKSKYDEKGNVQYLLIGKCKGKDMSDEISIVYQVQVYNEDTNCFEVIADKIQNVGIAEVREEEMANYGFADGKEHRKGDTSIFISKVTLTSTAIATIFRWGTSNYNESIRICLIPSFFRMHRYPGN